MIDINRLTTETVNNNTKDIDKLSTLDIVTTINREDQKVAKAVEEELPKIAEAVDKIAERFSKGGRIIYCGAGSSGRMGTLDAVELTPTYSVPPERAFGLMAGGKPAMYKAIEGAEDSVELGEQDLKDVNLTENDCVIGIAASGRTPYTISALEYANKVGALTISVTCNKNSKMSEIANISIAPIVGAEVINGSTRMKAGTAQKMVVNMLSTATMVKIGKVYQNYMVHVQPTNEKLVIRACRIISQIAEVDEKVAKEALNNANMKVTSAIVMLKTKCSLNEADMALEKSQGRIREAIELLNK